MSIVDTARGANPEISHFDRSQSSPIALGKVHRLRLSVNHYLPGVRSFVVGRQLTEEDSQGGGRLCAKQAQGNRGVLVLGFVEGPASVVSRRLATEEEAG